MDEGERIKKIDETWMNERRLALFHEHFNHWANVQHPDRDLSASMIALVRQIREMFAGERSIYPEPLDPHDSKRRTVIYIGGSCTEKDAEVGVWGRCCPNFQTQIRRMANMMWTGWNQAAERSCPANTFWPPLENYNQYGTFAVPCVPQRSWAMKDTYEKFLPSVARISAFYLLMTLRIVRPTCVILMDYASSQILSFALKHLQVGSAQDWLQTPAVKGTRLTTPNAYETARLRVCDGWSFHAFRFYTPFCLSQMAEKDKEGTIADYQNGMLRLVNTMNPAPLDVSTALCQPTPKQAKCRRASERKAAEPSKKQPKITFKSNDAIEHF